MRWTTELGVRCDLKQGRLPSPQTLFPATLVIKVDSQRQSQRPLPVQVIHWWVPQERPVSEKKQDKAEEAAPDVMLAGFQPQLGLFHISPVTGCQPPWTRVVTPKLFQGWQGPWLKALFWKWGQLNSVRSSWRQVHWPKGNWAGTAALLHGCPHMTHRGAHRGQRHIPVIIRLCGIRATETCSQAGKVLAPSCSELCASPGTRMTE